MTEDTAWVTLAQPRDPNRRPKTNMNELIAPCSRCPGRGASGRWDLDVAEGQPVAAALAASRLRRRGANRPCREADDHRSQLRRLERRKREESPMWWRNREVEDRLFEGEEAVAHAYVIGGGGGPKVVWACKTGARS